MRIVLYPKTTAERIISTSVKLGTVHLTGAEIALALSLLNEFDFRCLKAIEALAGVKATRRRCVEILKKAIEPVYAEKVLDHLIEMKIIRVDYSEGRKLYVPTTVNTRVVVEEPQSLLLLINKYFL